MLRAPGRRRRLARVLRRGSVVAGRDLDSLSRAELNALATQAGIEKPESLRTKADVIAALRETA